MNVNTICLFMYEYVKRRVVLDLLLMKWKIEKLDYFFNIIKLRMRNNVPFRNASVLIAEEKELDYFLP